MDARNPPSSRCTRSLRRRAASIAALGALVAACGIEPTTTAGGGIGGTGITAGSRIGYGSVSAFGSIYVSGVRYATETAAITKDGVAISERDLRIGMTVEVLARTRGDTEAIAEKVVVEETVAGIVESKAADHLVVLGQAVFVNEATMFDESVGGLAALAVGETVAIHGLIKGSGAVEATFVQRPAQTSGFTIRGLVDAHDAAASRFTIGALTVDYRNARTVNMPVGSWRGLVVKAQGGTCISAPACGTLSALEVDLEQLGVADAARADVEGFVTAVHTAALFMLGSQPVVVRPDATFAGGTAADIGAGVKLGVEGGLRGGVLHADRIVFRHNARVEATVAAVNATTGTITLADLPAVDIGVDAQTRFKSGYQELTDVAPGHRVRIRGRVRADNRLIASEVFQDQSRHGAIVLQGPTRALAPPVLTLLGISLDTRAVRSFRDERNQAIDAATFFDMLAPGTTIKVSGTRRTAGGVEWDEIEIEDARPAR